MTCLLILDLARSIVVLALASSHVAPPAPAAFVIRRHCDPGHLASAGCGRDGLCLRSLPFCQQGPTLARARSRESARTIAATIRHTLPCSRHHLRHHLTQVTAHLHHILQSCGSAVAQQAGLSRAETVATTSLHYEMGGCNCSMHSVARFHRPRPAHVPAIALSRRKLGGTCGRSDMAVMASPRPRASRAFL